MNLIRPRSNETLVFRDDNGKLSGVKTEHWDDSVDALVKPETQRYSLSPEEMKIVKKILGV